jgi:hypothetical protein
LEQLIALRLISLERLTPYLVSAPSDIHLAILKHQRSAEICGAMLPIIATLEIALRNSIDLCLIADFKNGDWLDCGTGPINWQKREKTKIIDALKSARRSAYARLSSTAKKALDNGEQAKNHFVRSGLRQAKLNVTRGDHISQITLFFWKRLFSSDYDAALWRNSLKKMFPNKSLSRQMISASLEFIYECRNRLSHHDTISEERLERFVKEVIFISQNLENRFPSVKSVAYKLIAKQIEAIDLLRSTPLELCCLPLETTNKQP